MRARPTWLLLFLFAPLSLAAQEPLFRRITMRDGLPSNQVYTIAQDREGFIWFGTDAGAARFDGTHIDRYNVADGLTDEEVFVVRTDSRGRLWFLTGNGRPCYMDRDGIHSWRTDTALAGFEMPSGIRSLHEDHSGSLWFGGLKGELATLSSSGALRMTKVKGPLDDYPGGHITIGSDVDGTPVVFSNARLVRLWDVRTPWLTDSMEQPNIAASYAGRTLCTTPRRVLEWKNGAWRTLVNIGEMDAPSAFKQTYLVGEHELWVAMWDGGVLWLREVDGKWQQVRETLFQSDLINNVLRDREGNVWLCTAYGGVIMFTDRAAGTAYYRGQRGVREEFLRVHAAEPAAGGVWCGTNQGDLYRLGAGLELVDLPPQGDKFSRVTSIRSYGNSLWTSTDRYLFQVIPHAEGDHAPEIRSIPSNLMDRTRFAGLKALTVGSDGRLVGSMYGLMELDRDKGVMDRVMDPNIPDLRIYAPHLDRRGTLWFEEQGRLFSSTAKGVRQHTGFALPTGTRITDMTSMGDTLVIGTSGRGLLLYADERVVGSVTAADGLSSDHVNHVTTHQGELFVATEQGAERVCGPWHAPRVYSYVGSIGARMHNVRDVAADSLYAYALFSDGLCRLPRSGEESTPFIPVPYIRSVLVNDSSMVSANIVGIRQGLDRLVVELGAVHFATPERVSLQYRLDRTDAWQPAVSGTLELAALGSGDHLLQVRAALQGGAWSNPAELNVVVVPRLRDRWWARGLLALAVALIVFGALRAAAYRRFKREEERVRQRELVANERQRIAMDLHDDLGAELSSLLLLTRMEHERPGTGSLAQLEQLASKLTDKIKEVIWSTDPGHDTLEATLSFIQRRLASLCTRHGLLSRTNFPPQVPDLELTAGVRRELFLLAKEAGNNAVKHAKATTFTFGATLEPNAVVLTFIDDGCGGVTKVGITEGQGLRNMAGRAATVGATFHVAEVFPHGTLITVRLPVPQNRPKG